MNYNTILFDADGTLFDYDHSEQFALSKLFETLNIPLKPDTVNLYRRINQSKWEQFEKGLITKERLQSDRFFELFSALEISDFDAAQINSDYLDFLGRGSFLFDGACEICRALHGKARLAIVTNGVSKTQYSRFEYSAIKDYFEALFVSEEIGYHKPDKRYFDTVFQMLGTNCNHTALIIGDSLTSDIQGGINAGIHTCWYNPLKEASHSGIRPTYEISSLDELRQITGV